MELRDEGGAAHRVSEQLDGLGEPQMRRQAGTEHLPTQLADLARQTPVVVDDEQAQGGTGTRRPRSLPALSETAHPLTRVWAPLRVDLVRATATSAR